MLKTVLFASLMLLAQPSAWAGAEVKRDIGTDINGPGALYKDVGTVIRENRRSGGNILRCWQEGRLFYEGSGFRGGPAPGDAHVVLRRDGDGDVILFDFRNGLCILSSN